MSLISVAICTYIEDFNIYIYLFLYLYVKNIYIYISIAMVLIWKMMIPHRILSNKSPFFQTNP